MKECDSCKHFYVRDPTIGEPIDFKYVCMASGFQELMNKKHRYYCDQYIDKNSSKKDSEYDYCLGCKYYCSEYVPDVEYSRENSRRVAEEDYNSIIYTNKMWCRHPRDKYTILLDMWLSCPDRKSKDVIDWGSDELEISI